jgi:membrane-associated phospholipid phosphatase
VSNNLRKYKIVSRVFDPIILATISFVIVFNLYNVNLSHSIIIFSTLVLIPVIFFGVNLYQNKVDYDLTDKRSRIPLYTLALFSSLLSYVLLVNWGYSELARVMIFFMGMIMILLAITLFWKISLHAIANTIFFGFIALIYNHLALIVVPPVVFLVGYSRVKLEKHTINQIIAGFILGSIFLGLIYFTTSI